MAPWTLYRNCLQAIADLLEAKFWNSSAENTFSGIPSVIIKDLVDFVMYRFSDDIQMITSLHPLFTSGRIKCLEAFHWNSRRKQVWLIDILYEDFCKNLTSLSLPKFIDLAYISRINYILPSCSNLVEVHLPAFFDVEIFESCPHLKKLRFHTLTGVIPGYFNFKAGAMLRIFRNLEQFSVCDFNDWRRVITDEIIANFLLNCPKLVSVGHCNSLQSFKYILERNINITPFYQLRRCCWRSNCGLFPPPPPRYATEVYSEYSDQIKRAVSLCPQVEELIIIALGTTCLQHFSSLKKLKLLHIDFGWISENPAPAFVTLLSKIGPQLKHLSVFMADEYPIPIDAICFHCPHLEAFRIEGTATFTEHAKASFSLPLLKRLCIDEIDNESLKHLLLNYTNITELFLFNTDGLDDELLKHLLEKDVFSKLEVAVISSTRLTMKGLIMFLEGISTLQKVSFNGIRENRTDAMNFIREWTSEHGVNVDVDEDLGNKGFICSLIDPCVF